jgi:hypothetical protein
MKKKGQTLGLTIISIVFFLIVGLMIINFIDTTISYWIILVFSVVIGAITARMFL